MTKYEVTQVVEETKKGNSKRTGKPWVKTIVKLRDEEGKEFGHAVTVWTYAKEGDVLFGDITSEPSKANPAWTNYTLQEPREDKPKSTTKATATFATIEAKTFTPSNKFYLLKDIAAKHNFDTAKTDTIKAEFQVWSAFFEEQLK
jgi:hypothetical protein